MSEPSDSNPKTEVVDLRQVKPQDEPTSGRPKVGVALAGGAARGIAHIGVLSVLTEHEIPIDFIAGTSAGSIAGGLFAAGLSTDRMAELIRNASWSDLTTWSLPRLGLLNFNRVTEWLDECLDGHPNQIEDLPIPFAAVAADIVSGELVAVTQGPLSQALRASSSVPGVMEPCRIGEHLLVDGGIINNLPVAVARQMGAEYVIAVDLLPQGIVGGKEPENVFDLMVTAFYMLMRATHNDGSSIDCIIQPRIGEFSMIDLGRTDELIAQGREAALEKLPQIRADLGLG